MLMARKLWRHIGYFSCLIVISVVYGCASPRIGIPDEHYHSQWSSYLAKQQHKSFWFSELGETAAGGRLSRAGDTADKNLSFFKAVYNLRTKYDAIALGKDACDQFTKQYSEERKLPIATNCILIAADEEIYYDIGPKLFSTVKRESAAELAEMTANMAIINQALLTANAAKQRSLDAPVTVPQVASQQPQPVQNPRNSAQPPSSVASVQSSQKVNKPATQTPVATPLPPKNAAVPQTVAGLDKKATKGSCYVSNVAACTVVRLVNNSGGVINETYIQSQPQGALRPNESTDAILEPFNGTIGVDAVGAAASLNETTGPQWHGSVKGKMSACSGVVFYFDSNGSWRVGSIFSKSC